MKHAHRDSGLLYTEDCRRSRELSYHRRHIKLFVISQFLPFILHRGSCSSYNYDIPTVYLSDFNAFSFFMATKNNLQAVNASEEEYV